MDALQAFPGVSPQQAETLAGIRALRFMTPQQLAEAAAKSTIQLPPDIARNIAQAAAMRQDAAALKGGGLPGYFDQQARTGAGMAPGAYQFNMPGPQSPAPSDLASIMKSRATAPSADAVATRQPKPGMTMEDFQSAAIADPFLSQVGRRDEVSRGASADYKGAIASGSDQDARDANRRLFAANPTGAAFNTYLRNRAKREGKAPDAVLADNAAAGNPVKQARAAARLKAMQGAQQQGGIQPPDPKLAMTNPTVYQAMMDAYLRQQQITNDKARIDSDNEHRNLIRSPGYLATVGGIQNNPEAVVNGPGGPMVIGDPVKRALAAGELSPELANTFETLSGTVEHPGLDIWARNMPTLLRGSSHEQVLARMVPHFARSLGTTPEAIDALVRQWYNAKNGTAL